MVIDNQLILKGIISDGKKNYAIVQYQNQSGEIQQDEIGGITTNLLPKDVIVKSIDLDKEVLILGLNEKLYEVKLNFE